MYKLVLIIIAIFLLILISEYYWRIRKTHTEITRKFVHITVGTIIAFCPYFLPWKQIILLALLFLVVILIARFKKIFGSIHKIDRKSYGDLLFAVAILVVLAITRNKLIFCIAMLHLGVADGLAAVIGTKYGKKNKYKVLKQSKSIIGSLTFYICSLVLIIYFISFAHIQNGWSVIIWLPIVATIFENVSLYGLDNITVPLLIALSLKSI